LLLVWIVQPPPKMVLLLKSLSDAPKPVFSVPNDFSLRRIAIAQFVAEITSCPRANAPLPRLPLSVRPCSF
jgi:hypothetical protein